MAHIVESGCSCDTLALQHTPFVSIFTSLIQAHVSYFSFNFHLNSVSAIGDSCNVSGTVGTVAENSYNNYITNNYN